MSGKATYHTKIARTLLFPVPSKQYSSKDMAGHTALKYRFETPQSIVSPHRIISQTFVKEEQEIPPPKKRSHLDSILSQFDDEDEVPEIISSRKQKKMRQKNEKDDESDDENENSNNENEEGTSYKKEDNEKDSKDSDDEERQKKENDKSKEDDDDDDDDEDEEDDEDDDAMLLAVLEKIKQERALKQLHEAEENQSMESLPDSKPSSLSTTLLSMENRSFAVRPRWDEDTVFRNQATRDEKEKKRFINDTVRNDFHKNFLKKYVK
ncbi:CWC15-like protein [Monocercomonoides exilis]|uniref:CWC15-like protein n=1 Tax=Monocercomonoides exilis TaxID=2049356 RepID=UPI00355A35AD|nr:CWC15-like protein [Monocercomonoides exilis]|eukprot:MONOS_1723.1-p1 / transcript=MONOS_1723.1 / gene=MONOS_1723 / organism=Monocercomonoides_exilis_PA203 / gene_product=unspecified product / transcript_product=unspecified product / location=Mono_scaffold00032:31834-32752(-) / protein_length=265 / sequence_SO=supercontig / SO=protein_coding / is_pseudo=false